MKLRQLLEMNHFAKQYIKAIEDLHSIIMENESKFKDKMIEMAENDNNKAINIFHKLQDMKKTLEDILI